MAEQTPKDRADTCPHAGMLGAVGARLDSIERTATSNQKAIAAFGAALADLKTALATHEARQTHNLKNGLEEMTERAMRKVFTEGQKQLTPKQLLAVIIGPAIGGLVAIGAIVKGFLGGTP